MECDECDEDAAGNTEEHWDKAGEAGALIVRVQGEITEPQRRQAVLNNVRNVKYWNNLNEQSVAGVRSASSMKSVISIIERNIEIMRK
jgi:hypothetical protein